MARIKHLTQDDIPYLDTPCYVTDSGEVYQWNKAQQEYLKRTASFGDSKHARVYLRLTPEAPNYSSTKAVAALVYRAFSDEVLPDCIFLDYKDGNPNNCAFENLYRTKKTPYRPRCKNQPKQPKPKKVGRFFLQQEEMELVFHDLNTVMCFLSMKRKYEDIDYVRRTDILIDTTGWSSEELQELSKIAHMDGVSIKK